MLENDLPAPNDQNDAKARRWERTRAFREMKDCVAIDTDRLYTDITPRLCKASRTLLAWDRPDLAATADVSEKTVCRYEGGGRVGENTVAKIEGTLEKVGIVFIDNGVILKWHEQPLDDPCLCQVARAMLGWTVKQLAHQAGISPQTVWRYERRDYVHEKSRAKIGRALAYANIEILEGGIRLVRPHEPKNLWAELCLRADAVRGRPSPDPEADYCLIGVCTAYELAVRAGFAAPLAEVDQLIATDSLFET